MRTNSIVAAVAILSFSSAHAQDDKPTANTKEWANGGPENKAQCPAGFYITAMQITKDTDKTQQRAINIWCTEFPEKVNRGGGNKSQDEKPTATTIESVNRGGDNKAQCPAVSSITAIQITKDRAINVWCAELPGKARRDEKPTATTKEPVNGGAGNKAQCPADSYITAIQITKDPDKTQQRAINIWCTLSREVISGAIEAASI
jgi:hypothetical protein